MNKVDNNSKNTAEKEIVRKGYLEQYPIGRVILASILGLVLAYFAPSMVITSILFCITPVILCALYAWAGWVPAAIGAAGTLCTMSYAAPIFGVNSVLMLVGTLLILLAPAAAVIYATEKRMKFFTRLTIAIAAQTAVLLIAMAVIYAGMKIDLVDQMIAATRESMDYLPAGSVSVVLQQFAMSGILTEESIAELSGGILTTGDISRVLDQAFEAISYTLKQLLPALILSSGLLSGIAMTSLSSRICKNCDRKPPVDHVLIDHWRVPPSTVGMLIVGSISGMIMQYSGVVGSEAVTMVFTLLAMELLIIQGIAAISRRFREVHASTLSRLGLITASLVFMPSFLEIMGILSLLFGSRGVITMWMKKRMEQKESEDDE